MAYEIVPTSGGQDPLDLLLEQEAEAAHRYDILLEADNSTQTRDEFIATNAQSAQGYYND
tara:strand:- start:280 stop:459 length:180 start_codon:yes stop_codon:yes gene_type:complete